MTWITLSLLSAIFLGIYDITKKQAVRDNAVAPVLLLSVITAALIWTPWIVLSACYPTWLPFELLRVENLGWREHGLLCAKSILVGCSWTCALFALKHLPISIASPIRATSPLWTVLIAVMFFGERPVPLQWAGISVILIAFSFFSRVGKAEGIHFHRNGWVGLMVIATLLGSISAIYDKYLLQTAGLSAATVQAWFSIYLVPVMCPLCLRWYVYERQLKKFQWRTSIPLIAVSLLIADFLYFTAIGEPGALISIISPVRRTAIIISFVAGVAYMGEKNWRGKAVCIAGIIVGVFLVALAAR